MRSGLLASVRCALRTLFSALYNIPLCFSICTTFGCQRWFSGCLHSAGGRTGTGGQQSGNPDPLTGGCSYNPATEASAANAPAASGLTYTPHREYRLFEGALAADKVAAKLQELSAAVPADLQPQAADFASGGAVPLLLEVCAILSSVGARSILCYIQSRVQCILKGSHQHIMLVAGMLYHTCKHAAPGMQIAGGGRGALADVIDVLGKLARWPTAQIFPVLDIFRLLVLHSGHARLLAADAGDLQTQNPGLGGLIARGLASDAPPAATLLAMRLACNCCAQPPLHAWLWRNSVALLDLVAEAPTAGNKVGRVALAALLLNLGVAIARGDAPGPEEERVRALSILCEVSAAAAAVFCKWNDSFTERVARQACFACFWFCCSTLQLTCIQTSLQSGILAAGDSFGRDGRA